MSRTPLLSICVPTYQGAEHFGECLDGLLGQNLKDLELLVGDDQSKDDTLAIARRRGDPRLRILPFTTRAGMSRNWTRTMAAARGKYVACVAQDDLFLPQWGERLVGLLESHPEAGLAFARRKFGITDEKTRAAIGQFFEVDYPAMLERFYARIESVVPPEAMIAAAMEHNFTVNLTSEPSFMMMRRDHPVTRAGYHPHMKQLLDWEFATRFFLAGPILYCAEELGTYRLHASGSSVGNSAELMQRRDYHLLLDAVLEHPGRMSAEQNALLHDRRMAMIEIVYARALGALGLEKERDQLLAHARTLEGEREHLLGHVSNLERILRKVHGMSTYRVLCRLKYVFTGR